jgi:hypothetical protein
LRTALPDARAVKTDVPGRRPYLDLDSGAAAGRIAKYVAEAARLLEQHAADA